MSFLEPLRLLGFIGVALLAVIYIALQFNRQSYAVRFTNIEMLDKVAPDRPGWRRQVPAVLFLLALSALVLGWAEPARDEEVPRERATVMLAIDTSLSMEAEDVSPSRIAGAKEAAVSFLDTVPEEVNVGLVSFNGNATVRVPPTTDRDAVMFSIETLELDEATAIGEAIFASLDAIAAVLPDEDGTLPPARIVLMSDGETTVGRANEDAVAAAVAANVPVSTIVFGTEAGVIVIEEFGAVPVPVNLDELRIIAEGTNGQFFSAETTEELSSIFTDLGSSFGFVTELTAITDWFIGLGLLLLLLSAAFSLLWFSRLP